MNATKIIRREQLLVTIYGQIEGCGPHDSDRFRHGLRLLKEFLDRFFGFAAVQEIGLQALRRSDFWTTVELCAEILGPLSFVLREDKILFDSFKKLGRLIDICSKGSKSKILACREPLYVCITQLENF